MLEDFNECSVAGNHANEHAHNLLNVFLASVAVALFPENPLDPYYSSPEGRKNGQLVCTIAARKALALVRGDRYKTARRFDIFIFFYLPSLTAPPSPPLPIPPSGRGRRVPRGAS